MKGRKELFHLLERQVLKLDSTNRIWFHSSSMGEFEQAKPIISALRKKYQDINIIVTFFSPSGYDHSKNYKLADIVTYIPFDTQKNAIRFLDLIQPTVAVFVRYDIWPNLVWALNTRKIPTFIANATMRSTSLRFYPLIKGFHRRLYNNFTSILTVSKQDVQMFNRFHLSIPKVEAVGETRYDQVWQRSAESRLKHLIPVAVFKGKNVFLAGSTWPEDEEVILPALSKILHNNSKSMLILVPHEPTIEALETIETKLNSDIQTIRFSAMNDYNNERVIIIDSVGILMALYQYAHVAYVGGSFKQGVHNVLEPAVYGIPVLFGPKHLNSQEAVELVRRGGGFIINGQQECFRTIRMLLENTSTRVKAGKEALALVKENIGATERVIKHLESVIA